MTAAENALVLNVVQALLGNVRPALRRVTVRAGEPTRIEFALEQDGPAEREALSDVVFELAALHDRPIEVLVRVDAGELGPPPGRPVYLRFEGDAWPRPSGGLTAS